MERLTHERVNGIKTGYWSAATKEVLVQKLAAYETRAMSPTRSAQPLNRLPRTAKPRPRPSWPSASPER